MSKKKRQTRQKVAKTLVSLFVLLIFAAPAYLTVKWVIGTADTRDPRKVVPTTAFTRRRMDDPKTPLKPFQEPLVSVSFDDGWESVYTQAFPVLQRDGVHTTQFIITGTFDNRSYMSVVQLQAMQRAGTDIASHTISHPDLTTLDDHALKHELLDSKRKLAHEFGDTQDFTSPYGAYNAHTLQMISKYYRSQKNAEGDPAANELEAVNVGATFNPLNIQSYSVRRSTTLDDLKKLLKTTEEHNAWLVLTYHQIDYGGETFSVSPPVFKQQIQLISNAPVRMPTMGQVLDAVLPKQKLEQ